MHKLINIYGRELTGKSMLALELCKYFYMNNYFKGGIYYINNINNKKWDKKGEFKDLKNKMSNEKDDIFENILIIFDDKNNLNSCLSYVLNLSLYIIIISKESIKKPDIKKFEKALNSKSNKKAKTPTTEQLNNLYNISYINLDQNLRKDEKRLREKFFNYLKINFYLKENKLLDDKAIEDFNLIKDNEELHINEIIKIIKTNE